MQVVDNAIYEANRVVGTRPDSNRVPAVGLSIPTEKVGTFDTELVEEFFAALCREAGLTLHLKQLDGTNSHHIIEGAFKAFARALREAVSIDPASADALPSTKGVL